MVAANIPWPALTMRIPHSTRHAGLLGTDYYLGLGGYLFTDFRTMSSILPSTFMALLFSTLAMERHTRERVEVSRRSITRVPSAYGTATTRVPQPRQPAG